MTRRPWHVALGALAAGLALASGPAGAGLAVAAGTAAALIPARAPILATAAAVLVLGGLVAGQARIAAIDAPGRLVRDGGSLSGRVQLLSRPRRAGLGTTAELRVLGGPLAGARLLARAGRWTRWPPRLGPGAELSVAGALRRPRTRSGSEFDFAAHLRRRGLAGELLLDRVRATGGRRAGLAGAVDRMRERSEAAVVAGLPREQAALLRGMVLGQDEEIPEPVRDDWRAAGLAHLLAVSGQNVMLLGALALPFLAALGLSPASRAGALLGLIAVYVPLAGAGPSLQRAGVMGAAGVVALAASRPASRAYALLLAAACTLALNPRACGDPGWQLSFAAVGGILALGPPIRRALGADRPGRGAARAMAEGAAITVAATVATAPLLAAHFGSLPIAGLAANLLALPAVAPAMWAGMLLAAVGQLGALGTPFHELADGASEAIGAGARVPVAYLGWLAERVAELPGGQLDLRLGPVGATGAYAAIVAGAVAAGRAGRRAGPRVHELAARWRRLPSARRLCLAAALIAAAVLLGARLMAPAEPPGRLTVRFLDVSQGDATLIQHPDGTAVLFDGGPPEARVARALRRFGVRRLAVVVATHASRDHHGGLAEVIDRYPVDFLLDGGDGTPDRSFRAVLGAAARRGARRVRAVAPLSLGAGGLRIEVLSPAPRPPGPPPEDPNPRAVIAVVSSGGFDLLLSADAESEVLAVLNLPDVEAMKVPHHGSADPGLPQVLSRLRPEMAAIEVGPNTYGHPTPSTLAALRRARVPTWRTDRAGTVSLTVDSSGMRVSTER